jgi:tetratricopeptide (TPR) repeat protein
LLGSGERRESKFAANFVGPTPTDVIDSRGFVHLRLGRPDEAITCYDAALSIRPLVSASLYDRGLAKRRQGKIDEHDKQMALLIQRGNNRLFVPVTLG